MRKPSARRRAPVLLFVSVLVLGACGGGSQPDFAEDLEFLGYFEPKVAVVEDDGRMSVTVTSSDGPSDEAAATAAARLIWTDQPGPLVGVRITDDGRLDSFSRSRMESLFGERDDSLDRAAVPRPGEPLPVDSIIFGAGAVLAVALVGATAVTAARRRRSEAVDAAGSNSTFGGMVFATRRHTGLDRLAAEDATPIPRAAPAVRITTEDVLDILTLIDDAGAGEDVWLAGRWAVRASVDEGPDALPELDLVVTRRVTAAVMKELSAVGFNADWKDARRAGSRVITQDHEGRRVRVRAVTVVDEDIAGSDETVPRDRLTLGILAGRTVPVCRPATELATT